MDFNLKGKRKPFFGACIMTAAVALVLVAVQVAVTTQTSKPVKT